MLNSTDLETDQTVVFFEITKDGIQQKKYSFKYLILASQWLGRENDYVENQLRRKGMNRILVSSTGHYYIITRVGSHPINYRKTAKLFVQDHDWMRQPTGQFEAGRREQFKREQKLRRELHHQKIKAVLAKLNKKYHTLTDAYGSPEFKELQKVEREAW